MSWLFKSLQIDDPDPDSDSESDRTTKGEISTDDRGGGMKDDLSVIGHKIGRQLRGVAAFLAPPPPSDSAVESPPLDPSPSPAIAGIRNDLAEIGGSFKSGLSRLSSNKAVSEISKLASNFWQFQISEEEEDERGYDRDEDVSWDGSPGITEEIVGFVEEISIRPECWTDFPLSLDNDFEISDAQRKHASAISHLVPDLTALRSNLSNCMKDEQFWMIYFILLLPRLSTQDSELLATPQIVETRDLLLENLRKRRNSEGDSSKTSETPQEDISTRQAENAAVAPDASEPLKVPHDETADQTSEETDTDKAAVHQGSRNTDQDDDFSFSDLEDNDSDLSNKRSSRGTVREPSPSGSSDWIQLKRSPKRPGAKARESDGEEESSDWLAVGDSD